MFGSFRSNARSGHSGQMDTTCICVCWERGRRGQTFISYKMFIVGLYSVSSSEIVQDYELTSIILKLKKLLLCSLLNNLEWLFLPYVVKDIGDNYFSFFSLFWKLMIIGHTHKKGLILQLEEWLVGSPNKNWIWLVHKLFWNFSF